MILKMKKRCVSHYYMYMYVMTPEVLNVVLAHFFILMVGFVFACLQHILKSVNLGW